MHACVLDRALEVGEQLVATLRAHPASERVEIAGSARRMTETVKDLDVIATAADPLALARGASELELVETAQTPRAAGVRLRLHTGLPVDMRIVAPDQFGNLLQHLTGSKRHNMALRDAAVRKGLHVSEYGVLDDSTGETDRCATEAEVYRLLGLEYIEPELREDRGELEAGGQGKLPDLIERADLKGDLHCHTDASDGTASIAEMGRAARDSGYDYLAITDHSASFGFGDDLSPDRLREHVQAIRATEIEGIELLAGSEVNILPDGSLDYDDEVLQELDWVIASVHSSFRMSAAAMTQRMVRAIEHPLVDAIGHPTGRKIERRPPYEVDMEALIEVAARTGTMLEINANPDRRDLSELHARAASEAGAMLVINTDSHRVTGFQVARYGIATARRAWLGSGTSPTPVPGASCRRSASRRARGTRRPRSAWGLRAARRATRGRSRRTRRRRSARRGGRRDGGDRLERRRFLAPEPIRRMPAALGAHEPQEPDRAQDARDEEVHAQTEEVVGIVDPLGLLEDAKARVAGDVEREDARRPDALAVAPLHPDQEAGEQQVPDQLVEEGRLERGVLQVSGRPVGGRDLERPGQLGGRAEQLLVEVVADPADRLGDQQCGRHAVHEQLDLDARHALSVQTPQAATHTRGDPAPDPRPPFQTANGPHQCGGICDGVVIRK